MILFLSFLCFAVSALLTLNGLFFKWPQLLSLPGFTGTAVALVGVLIAALEYRARRTKKKKRAPMALIICNAFAGIAAVMYWIFWLIIA